MMNREQIDPSACRDLWTAVLTLAITDLSTKGMTPDAVHLREHTHALFLSSDMLTVAALAGLDGRAVRARHLAGQLHSDLLTGARQVHHAVYSAA